MPCVEPTEGIAVCLNVSDISAATWATVLIAILTSFVFLLQILQHRHNRRVTNANYMLALHEKRLETFFAIRGVMNRVFRDGKPTIEDAFRLREQAQTAKYLFPEDVIHLLEEIADNAHEHHRQHQIWQGLRKRATEANNLTDDETKAQKEALDEKYKIEKWFFDLIQGTELNDVLDPYLVLPDSL
jgi:hypothetical protein